MAADSLHVAVHLVVPSGVSFRLLLLCRRACSAGAFAPHFALPPAQPSSVQTSCLERARPAALAAFTGGLAASSAAPPGRRCRERKREAKAEGKTKGGGTQPPAKPVCTWGGAARRGFAAVPRGARGPRRYGHVRVLRTTGHATTSQGDSDEQPPR